VQCPFGVLHPTSYELRTQKCGSKSDEAATYRLTGLSGKYLLAADRSFRCTPAQQAAISTISKGKLMRNKIYPLENQVLPAQSHTLSDHDLNSISAGQEAREFGPSPIFAADSDAPGLGNRGFLVGTMTMSEIQDYCRQHDFTYSIQNTQGKPQINIFEPVKYGVMI
jgi:hypothetical protein